MAFASGAGTGAGAGTEEAVPYGDSLLAALRDTVSIMANNRGLPVVACLGLTLTSGCTDDGDPIVGHWDLRERVMPDETITYPYSIGDAECTYTNELTMDIGADLEGTQERTSRYECDGYPPMEYSYDYPLSVEVLEASALYRITLPEPFDSGGSSFPGSDGGDPPEQEEEPPRQMDCTLDGRDLECEEQVTFSDGEDTGDGPEPPPPPDPTVEIHVWRFLRG